MGLFRARNQLQGGSGYTYPLVERWQISCQIRFRSLSNQAAR